MSSLSFLSNPLMGLVADASVIINLNATGRAAEIIKAFQNPVMVAENTCVELQAGAQRGHNDHHQLTELVEAGLVKVASLGISGAGVYESLVNGSTAHTLDDGEAATIAYADENGCVALIDERKARTLCSASFPRLVIASTAELLMHDVVTKALGAQGRIDALMNALMNARMRVPAEHLPQLRTIIGAERAASCLSLPKHIRRSSCHHAQRGVGISDRRA